MSMGFDIIAPADAAEEIAKSYDGAAVVGRVAGEGDLGAVRRIGGEDPLHGGRGPDRHRRLDRGPAGGHVRRDRLHLGHQRRCGDVRSI